MIRFRNYVYEEFDIDPKTAIITNKDGVIQKTRIKDGRTVFKSCPVYCIMMHTHKGYKKRMSIHHKDFNKLNDTLENLQYVTAKEHIQIHLEHDLREKLKEAYVGEGNPVFGKHWKYNEEQLERRTQQVRKSHGERVRCIETGEIFESITEATEKYGNGHIIDVCLGIRNKACGLHWEYVDKEVDKEAIKEKERKRREENREKYREYKRQWYLKYKERLKQE